MANFDKIDRSKHMIFEKMDTKNHDIAAERSKKWLFWENAHLAGENEKFSSFFTFLSIFGNFGIFSHIQAKTEKNDVFFLQISRKHA